jgi:putative inorganic carbon (HCO3(-)) transporter
MAARPALATSVPLAFPWAAFYCASTLAIWVLAPFLRRVIDWKTHFSAISPLAALPILILVPAAAMVWSARPRKAAKAFEVVISLWLLGFGYALVVAILAGHILGGIYTFVQFTLPVGFAYWIATSTDDAEIWYQRISKTLIVLAVVSGLYGVIQYIVLPPWDAAWMQSIAMRSNGIALPFEVRVFSMLNSPGTFAAFLTVATVTYLPRLNFRSAALLLPVFAGLGLSLVRAGWVVLPLAILVFALLTTRRRQLLKGVAAFVGVGVIGIALLTFLGATGIGSVLQTRLATLSDIGNDESASNRAVQMSEALAAGIADPEGGGLGSIGVGTRLNSVQESASALDSGYLCRFVEMGVAGTVAFLGGLGFALSAAVRVWRGAIRAGDGRLQDLAAVAIALQVAMLALNLFGDADFGLGAIVTWVSLALILRGPLWPRTAR